MQVSTTIPINPAVGHLVLDSATNRIYVWSGQQWNVVTGVSGPAMNRAVIGPLGLARERDEQKIKRIRTLILYGMLGGIAGRIFVETLNYLVSIFL